MKPEKEENKEEDDDEWWDTLYELESKTNVFTAPKKKEEEKDA